MDSFNMEVNGDRILLVLPVSHLSFPRVFGGISFKPPS